jgi:NADH dehydrogenase
MNFIIVGGGPTGVELAGALAEMKKNVLPRDYPEKDFSSLTIYLIEGAPNVLNPMSENSQKMSKKYLEDLGVVVKTDTMVSNYNGKVVTFHNGETINSTNVIWAAGVIGNSIDGLSKDIYTRGNRIKVNRLNQIENSETIFALGDICYMETPKYKQGHPQVASVAIEQAQILAKNFKNMLKQKSLTEFEYHDKGSMATIGKRKAVVDLPQFSFDGRLAWFTWMFVHLMLILSVKNKLIIFINWMFSYFSNDSTLRILIKPSEKKGV